MIDLAKSGAEFHLSKAMMVYAGDYIPTRINGEPNPRYHETLRAVQDVLSKYGAYNNRELVIRRDGRHNILQLREKVM